ncbi:hypothetical protein DENSPDRAFT_127244 [Dentipellis sp. KUC8613]|nr:hypothetical protein DENSPDRAFT_127244 [Dentipellis sp. KUC8613]
MCTIAIRDGVLSSLFAVGTGLLDSILLGSAGPPGLRRLARKHRSGRVSDTGSDRCRSARSRRVRVVVGVDQWMRWSAKRCGVTVRRAAARGKGLFPATNGRHCKAWDIAARRQERESEEGRHTGRGVGEGWRWQGRREGHKVPNESVLAAGDEMQELGCRGPGVRLGSAWCRQRPCTHDPGEGRRVETRRKILGAAEAIHSTFHMRIEACAATCASRPVGLERNHLVDRLCFEDVLFLSSFPPQDSWAAPNSNDSHQRRAS